jgi:hypothetical protein
MMMIIQKEAVTIIMIIIVIYDYTVESLAVTKVTQLSVQSQSRLFKKAKKN